MELSPLGLGGAQLGNLYHAMSGETAVCARHGVELPDAALALPRTHPAVTSVVVGAHAPDQVTLNVRRAAAKIPAGLWHDLKDAGLVRAGVLATGDRP
ncbi:hypothetical protein [Amycolatopsis panacis]|uniref:hypothetical protein n=1 Tax=Amycolatopsis panacis TaxID=2340917 RepID=UPI0038994981